MQAIGVVRIEQGTSTTDPMPRDKIFYINMLIEAEINKSTDSLIQTARIVVPKRFLDNTYATFSNNGYPFGANPRGIWIQDDGYFDFVEQAQQVETSVNTINYNNPVSSNFVTNIDNLTSTGGPVFRRGDVITLWMGYYVDDPLNKSNGNNIKLTQAFRGYIAAVNATDQVELLCEDFMWYLKQLRIQNRHYNTNADLPGNDVDADYAGISNQVIQISQGNDNNRLTKLTTINDSATSYPITKINGMIFDSIKNSTNDYELGNKGFFPLIWKLGPQPEIINGQPNPNYSNGPVPKPYLCFSSNPEYSLGNVTLNQNSTMFNFFEFLKNDFNQNTYITQLSAAYTWGLNKNGIPYYHDPVRDIDSTEPAVGNYVNLGFTRYPPGDIYTPQVYPFTLNGPDCLVMNANLTYKRSEDFLCGAIVKSWKMAKAIDTTSGVSSTGPIKYKTNSNGDTVQKVVNYNIHVGDYGGFSFTYFYYKDIALDANNVPTPASAAAMQKYGEEQLAKVHYTGYYGSITILGYPFVNTGDYVFIDDPLYPERNGGYRIKQVIYRYNNSSALTQELFLDYFDSSIVDPTLSVSG